MMMHSLMYLPDLLFNVFIRNRISGVWD